MLEDTSFSVSESYLKSLGVNIDNYSEVQDIAKQDSTAGGVFFVPAFQGLFVNNIFFCKTIFLIKILLFSRSLCSLLGRKRNRNNHRYFTIQ